MGAAITIAVLFPFIAAVAIFIGVWLWNKFK